MTLSPSVLEKMDRHVFDGRQVYLCSKADININVNKITLCCAIPIRHNDQTDVLIVMLDEFSKLNRMTQKFILWHEIGHLVLGHMDHNTPRTIDEELAADAYAVKHLSKSVGVLAITETISVIGISSELEQRLSALQ